LPAQKRYTICPQDDWQPLINCLVTGYGEFVELIDVTRSGYSGMSPTSLFWQSRNPKNPRALQLPVAACLIPIAKDCTTEAHGKVDGIRK